MVNGAAFPKRPHDKLGEKRAVALIGKPSRAQRAVDKNVGVRPPAIHA